MDLDAHTNGRMRQIVQVCVVVRKIILVGAVVVIAACSRTEQKPEPRPEPKPQAPAAKTPPDAGSIAQPKAPGTKRGPSVETVDATTPIAGMTITLEADGTAGWKLTARNDTDDMLSLVWDESSFVTGDGKSWGRLVPGVTRMLDVEKSHPAAPLAPHSSVTELVIPQVMVAYNEPLFEYDARRELNSGRLYVVVQSAAGKKPWFGRSSRAMLARVAGGVSPPSLFRRGSVNAMPPNASGRKIASTAFASALTRASGMTQHGASLRDSRAFGYRCTSATK